MFAPLLTEFRQASEAESEFLDGLASVFRDCEEQAACAVDPLIEIVLDSSQPLDDPNPNVRLGACRTLGYLGEVDVQSHRSRMLKAKDWRIAYSAALSLTQLGAEASRPALAQCRESHWYPRVQYAADFALRRLAGESETETDRKRLGAAVDVDNLESAFNGYDFQDDLLRPLDDLSELGIAGSHRDPGTRVDSTTARTEKGVEGDREQNGGFKSFQKTDPAIHRAIMPPSERWSPSGQWHGWGGGDFLRW